MAENGNKNDDAQRIRVSKDGTATLATGEPLATEKEIYDDIQDITIRLDGMYWELAKAMEPFQTEWDADPVAAMRSAVLDGAASGCADWAESMGELFSGETWSKLGDWLGDAAGNAADAMAGYAKEQAKEIEELLDKPGQTIFNTSWWFKQASDTVKKQIDNIQTAVSTAQRAAGTAVEAAAETVEQAAKIWKHRDAIAELPNMISLGDVKAVENFVDTVLMDIAPEFAKEIRGSKEFYITLALIDDPDSILTYMTYMNMALDAIPPNFLAYLGGKAGMFVVCEIIMTVILALLTAGAGVIARVTALLARIAANSAKVAGAATKITRAMTAFEMMVRRLSDVAGLMRALGSKLAKRQRGVHLKSPTRSTMVAKRETVKRDPKCAICGSTHHHTPANYIKGTVVYR